MPDLQFTELPTSRRRPLAAARPLAPADRGAIAHLTIRVRPKTSFSALQASVDDIYAKPATERRYMTRQPWRRHMARPKLTSMRWKLWRGRTA